MTKYIICAALGFGLVASVSATRPRAEADPSATWNRKAAAAYLDQRATWWTTWPTAQRDHGTFCVSCHTALPYALARPALRQPLGESAPPAGEAALLANITKRVTMWRDVEPFYPDQTRGVPKTSESRATEAILNAVILARRDARAGSLSEEGRRALDNMWALQMKTGEQTGAWTWLQFHNEPWEGDSSAFHGAIWCSLPSPSMDATEWHLPSMHRPPRVSIVTGGATVTAGCGTEGCWVAGAAIGPHATMRAASAIAARRRGMAR